MNTTSYIAAAAMALAMAVAATSCIEDNTTYGDGPGSLPAIKLGGAAASAQGLPEINTNFGQNCVIDPQVNYAGTGQLDYKWSVCTYNPTSLVDGNRGPLELVSTEPVFDYFFPTGGTYIVQLNVTDGLSGVAQEYLVNINRTFERGLMVIANDPDGRGNLTFVKDMTPEEIQAGADPVIVEHVLGKVNPEVDENEPLTGVNLSFVSWPRPGYYRLAVGSATHCYFLEPNELTMVSDINLTSTVSGFRSQYFYLDQGCVRNYDPVMKRYVTCKLENMFGIEQKELAGHGYDHVVCGNYFAWGTSYACIYYIEQQPLTFHSRWYGYDDNWASVYGWESTRDITNDGKPLFDGETLVSCYMGTVPGLYSDDHPCYVITRNPADGKYYTTLLYNAEFDHYNGYGSTEMRSRAQIDTNASTALPADGAQMLDCPTYMRTYYPVGNAVYMTQLLGDAHALPQKSQACLTYPDGEEVTCMYLNELTSGALDLYVATFNASTGRGSIYIYDAKDVRTDNPGAPAKAVYPSCTGRVKQLMYKQSI